MSVREQISRQRTLLMCVLVSQAAMHSGMFLPVAPGDVLPPEVSTGTGARALGSAVVAESRVAAGSVWVLTPTELVVIEVADPGAASPRLDPAAGVDEPVVVVVGAVEEVVGDARPVVEFGSGGVARS